MARIDIFRDLYADACLICKILVQIFACGLAGAAAEAAAVRDDGEAVAATNESDIGAGAATGARLISGDRAETAKGGQIGGQHLAPLAPLAPPFVRVLRRPSQSSHRDSEH